MAKITDQKAQLRLSQKSNERPWYALSNSIGSLSNVRTGFAQADALKVRDAYALLTGRKASNMQLTVTETVGL